MPRFHFRPFFCRRKGPFLLSLLCRHGNRADVVVCYCCSGCGMQISLQKCAKSIKDWWLSEPPKCSIYALQKECGGHNFSRRRSFIRAKMGLLAFESTWWWSVQNTGNLSNLVDFKTNLVDAKPNLVKPEPRIGPVSVEFGQFQVNFMSNLVNVRSNLVTFRSNLTNLKSKLVKCKSNLVMFKSNLAKFESNLVKFRSN